MTKVHNLRNQKKKSVSKNQKRDRKNRKSISQKMALWQFYRELNGRTPSKQTINNLANQLGLKVSQVYKWFWDMNRKVDTCQDQIMADNKDSKPLPEQGLTTEFCAQAFPNLPDLNNIQPDEFELLAIEVGINVEGLAQDLIDLDSPTATRQIVKRVRRVVLRDDEDQPMPAETTTNKQSVEEKKEELMVKPAPEKVAITPSPMKSKPLLQLPTEQSAFQLVRQPTILVNDAPMSMMDAQSQKDSLSRKHSVRDLDSLFRQKQCSPLLVNTRQRIELFNGRNKAYFNDLKNFDTFSRNSSQRSNKWLNPKSIGNTPQMLQKPKLSPFTTKMNMSFPALATPMFGAQQAGDADSQNSKPSSQSILSAMRKRMALEDKNHLVLSPQSSDTGRRENCSTSSHQNDGSHQNLIGDDPLVFDSVLRRQRQHQLNQQWEQMLQQTSTK